MASFTLTPAWQKIASSGTTVQVQNVSTNRVYIATSTGTPSAQDGIVLRNAFDNETLTLTADLYARCDARDASSMIEVMGGVSSVGF